MMMDASSAIPYGTWRGSSSSRMTGLTKSTLAIHELLDGRPLDGVAEENAALGAVHRSTLGLARHLEKNAAKPPVGRVAHPCLAERVVGLHVRLLVAVAEHLAQLGVVLGPRVRRTGVVGKVDAQQRDTCLAEHRVSDDPRRGAHVSAAVEARQAIGLEEPARHAVRLLVVVVHRVPPVHGDAGGLA